MVKLLLGFAPAKINLFLRITGRRADGYHELDSIFAPVAIFDQIALEIRPAATSDVALSCNWPELGPADQNLAVRAAREFMREFGVRLAVRIDLRKTIPAGAGLGGGSSDAAAVLRAMALLCRIEAPDRLRTIALGLGADVPFFLAPRPARVRGIGEQIAPLERMPLFDLVIAAPPISVSTAAVFRALSAEGWSGAAPDDTVRKLISGEVESAALRNDLAPIAIARYPEIGRLIAIFERSGARAASMSGSGGAVFGIYDSQTGAIAAAEKISAEFAEARVFATRILPGLDVTPNIPG